MRFTVSRPILQSKEEIRRYVMRRNLQKLNIRVLALVMASALLLCMTPAVSAAETSGTCGKKLEWSFSGDTLTITGSGDMTNFPENELAPWYPLRGKILSVQLPDGLTSVGDMAFYGCEKLTVVSIPDSVQRIGKYAFSDCANIEMLSLSRNLRSVGDCAFAGCVRLKALRLPDGLQSIGLKSFYRCESIATVTVPASVTSIGISAFAYCKKLVSASVRANVTQIPEFLFYGCELLDYVELPDSVTGISSYAFRGCGNLDTVSYDGSTQTPEQIMAAIGQDVPEFRESGAVTGERTEGATSSSIYEGENGAIIVEQVTTTENGDVTVTTTVQSTWNDGKQTSTDTNVDVVIENENGWEETTKVVGDAVNENKKNENASDVNVNIYLADETPISPDFFDAMADEDVHVGIVTENGSAWKIDCTTLDEKTAKDVYDLSYERADATAEQLELMGCAVGYQIRFASNAQVNAEVLIKLPIENARKNASLYHIKLGGDPELLQTVVVDNDGYAHFYLARVERGTQYLIGIDVQGLETEDAIVPEVLFLDFGVTDNLSDTEYVVTGRTSSWGLSFNQVTWIMVGSMLTVVVAVGLIMYALNKRKLKMGYIPELDEEDYDL